MHDKKEDNQCITYDETDSNPITQKSFTSGMQAFTLQDWLARNPRDRYHDADAYTKEVGDDVGLFFEFLLSRLPLDLAADHWSGKEHRWIRPRNHSKQKFLSEYAIFFFSCEENRQD